MADLSILDRLRAAEAARAERERAAAPWDALQQLGQVVSGSAPHAIEHPEIERDTVGALRDQLSAEQAQREQAAEDERLKAQQAAFTESQRPVDEFDRSVLGRVLPIGYNGPASRVYNALGKAGPLFAQRTAEAKAAADKARADALAQAGQARLEQSQAQLAETTRHNKASEAAAAAKVAAAANKPAGSALSNENKAWVAETKGDREIITRTDAALGNLSNRNGTTDLGALLDFVTAASGSKRFNATEIKQLENARSLLSSWRTRIGNAVLGTGYLSDEQRAVLGNALGAIRSSAQRNVDAATQRHSSIAHSSGFGDAFDSAISAGGAQPSSGASASAGAPGGTVHMIGPDGSDYDIPAERAGDAEAKGYRRAN